MQRRGEGHHYPHPRTMAHPPHHQMNPFYAQYTDQIDPHCISRPSHQQTVILPPSLPGFHHFTAPPSFRPLGQNPYTAAYATGLPSVTSARYTSTIYEHEGRAPNFVTDSTTIGASRAKPREMVGLKPSKNSDRRSIAIAEDATATLPHFSPNEDNTMSVGASDSLRGTSCAKRQSLSAAPPRRRRVSAILADRLAVVEDELEENKKLQSMLRKEARRKTIYIPDDTTIMTIHPGGGRGDQARDSKQVKQTKQLKQTRDDKALKDLRRYLSPDSGLDLVTLSEGPESPYPVLKHSSTNLDTKKASRKSLAIPPKRAPLGHAKRALQQNVTFAEEVCGPTTGKENIAPGYRGMFKPIAKPMDDMARARLSIAGLKVATPEKTNLKIGSSPAKRKGTDSILDFSPKPTKIKTLKSAAHANSLMGSLLSNKARPVRTVVFEDAKEMRVLKPTATMKPHATTIEKVECSAAEKYKVLSEDLAHPSLYEDHWLEHQEISLSQLLNNIFEPQHVYKETPNAKALRKLFLDSYHDPQIPIIYKRLQASLLYGALSLPKDLLAKASRIRDDIGLKKKFLDLWVENYDLVFLRAALEVIVGREMPQLRLSGVGKTAIATTHTRSGSQSSIELSRDRLSTGSETTTRDRKVCAAKQVIERFLDAFFIRHEDAARPKGTIASIAQVAEQKADEFGSHAWAWRRTVLRSLMLILLLDKIKTAGVVQGCLFQSSSEHKSSTAVLTALGGLLLPSLGTLTRPLSHLNYEVNAEQFPLQQYQYCIANLATDLRDGVKLTRLIELMLFNKATMAASSAPFPNSTMTLSLPAGDILTSNWIHDPSSEWALSQHVKFPCAGRAQKIYNVQIALSALHTLGGAVAIASKGITADDIVDGHRERTLSLLWAIVGNRGLGTLVDWQELKREVRHFRLLAREGISAIAEGFLEARDSSEAIENAPSIDRCTKFLLAWAQSIAALRSLHVTNLTTSFSDPRILHAVVDAYMPYFPIASDTQANLSAKLKMIGCSTAFTELFSTQKSANIPSEAFVVSTLAFLASRLLPLSRLHRAATVIQRAVRSHQRKANITRRVALARLAHHCAVVVQTRERVVSAAIVLQRAWRSVLRGRIERLVQDIVGVQSTARGWIVREKLRGGGRIQRQRIAGW